MKTKKVLKTIDVMTESVVKELNDMNEKIDNKANHSYVQTIAKHLMNLEARVGELENEKCNCKPNIADPDVKEVCLQSLYDAIQIKPAMVLSQILGFKKSLIDFDKMTKEMERAEKIAKEKYYSTTEHKNGHTLLTKLGEIEFILNPKAKPQTDYFLKAKNLLIDYAEKTMIKKGMEYTPVGDRFANFRPILGEKKTAIEKLIGYNAKHVQYCFMQESNMTAKTINELLEHWGDVFNYNVLGLAMRNTDKEPYYIVPYADRETQEQEIKNIVDSMKPNTIYCVNAIDNAYRYRSLLNTIQRGNLLDIIYLFAQQLKRLEN